MVKYYFDKQTFVVEDYQHAKKFCSFLPAIGGPKGKPLWAFYASVGQCMGGFGVNDKETPITPFDSATLAYQNIPIKSFRTFLRINEKVVTPFFYHEAKQTLRINKSDITIIEEDDDYKIEITYSSVSNRSYPGLIRKFKILAKIDRDFEIVDGLPIIFPHGLSNVVYKELVSLMGAYCQIDLGDNRPFIKFKTSTADASEVALATSGNCFVSIDENNKRLDNIVSVPVLFGDDATLIHADNFVNGSYISLVKEQQIENQIPCAFSFTKKHLSKGEEYSFITLFSSFNHVNDFETVLKELSFYKLDAMINETAILVEELLPHHIKTSNSLFDECYRQAVLDNDLRGGFPILLDDDKEGQIYYLYSRKHGDMERDYNAFKIPSLYYSSGPGNFRDVNQNRRSDLYFLNQVKDYNIKTFFSLIQVDGQNPLTVKPLSFSYLKDKKDIVKHVKGDFKDRLTKELDKYTPSSLFTLLDEHQKELDVDKEELFKLVLKNSKQNIEASFGEGYWVDHWTYNVDLLNNYLSVFPDKMEELLFNNDYKYFYSHVYVNPRDEKYCLLKDNKVRQYGALDLKAFKKENEKHHLKGDETLWLIDKDGKEVTTSLASKIFNLIMVKFSTLDHEQMGIEMECEKPGWNDAMNGLPGLFASAMSESIELLRLVNYLIEVLPPFKNRSIDILKEQHDLYLSLKENMTLLLEGKLSSFTYWDKVTSAREKLRLECKENVLGSVKSLQISDILLILEEMKAILTKGILKAKTAAGDNIIPSYIVHEVDKYELTGKINHLGYPTVKPLSFKNIYIPPFLEASARMMKLGPEFFNEKDYQIIYKSDLRDQKLGVYKTCADIEDAPFEIGRVHAFTKGWLERECDFLHMAYKYMLGLLKSGLYERFYEEAKHNLIYNLDPYVYGRSVIEASSFIVPTCNPDKSKHGQGHFARLTGANAEFIDMFFHLFVGEKLFVMKNNQLTLNLSPKLSKGMFDENDKATFEIFNNVEIVYHNPHHLDCYKGVKLSYLIGNKKYEEVSGKLASDIREGKIKHIEVEISE